MFIFFLLTSSNVRKKEKKKIGEGKEDIPHSNTNSFRSIDDFFIKYNHPMVGNSILRLLYNY